MFKANITDDKACTHLGPKKDISLLWSSSSKPTAGSPHDRHIHPSRLRGIFQCSWVVLFNPSRSFKRRPRESLRRCDGLLYMRSWESRTDKGNTLSPNTVWVQTNVLSFTVTNALQRSKMLPVREPQWSPCTAHSYDFINWNDFKF